MRRAKIVCTLGPAVSTPERIRAARRGGHGRGPAQPLPRRVRRPRGDLPEIRKASDETGHAVGILVDLQGPKIRTAPVQRTVRSTLANGAEFTITTRDVDGVGTEVGTTYKGLPGDVSPATRC